MKEEVFGPIFLNDSGFIMTLATRYRELWNLSEYNVENVSYEWSIFSSGSVPMISVKLNFDALEELFYKLMGIYQRTITVVAMPLPISKAMERTTLTVSGDTYGISMHFNKKSISNTGNSIVDLYISHNDMAIFMSDFIKLYFKGAGLHHDFEQEEC